jgi:hypothetical protein
MLARSSFKRLTLPFALSLGLLFVSLAAVSFFPNLARALKISFLGKSLSIFGGYHILFSLVCWIAMMALIVFWPVQDKKKSALLICSLGLLARLFLFSQYPSDDINRYLWEGKVLAHGLSPYSFAAKPQSPDAAQNLRRPDDRFWKNINHPEMTAIYPPLFQVLMRGVAAISYSEICVRIVLLLFDLGSLFILLLILKHMQLGLRWALFYALNPVILLGFAGHCHQDVTMIFFILAAVLLFYKKSWKFMFLCLGLSVQMKYFSLLCLPFFVTRDNYRHLWLFIAAAVFPFFPFLISDGAKIFASFSAFGSEFSFNAFFPEIIACLPQQYYAFAGILLLISASYLYVMKIRSRLSTPITGCIFVFILLFVSLPTVHFWYVSWLIPFICLRPKISLIVFCLTIMLTLNTYATFAATNLWQIPWQVQFVIWLPIAVYLLMAARRQWHSRQVEPVQEALSGFSVIIPVKNEELELEAAIDSVKRQEVCSEIIVVDSGSTDATPTIAKNAGARLISFDKTFENGGGRGGQICSGIENSSGDIIIVLHADTRLQAGILKRIETVLQLNPDISSGAVGSVFVNSQTDLKILEAANNFRAGILGISFGDQVQFCRRSSQNAFALFAEMPLMEDVEFSIRSFLTGGEVFLWGSNQVSARKWQKNQGIRAILIIKLLAEYLLKRLYGKVDAVRFYKRYYLNEKI